jgi:hypothetical protein
MKSYDGRKLRKELYAKNTFFKCVCPVTKSHRDTDVGQQFIGMNNVLRPFSFVSSVSESGNTASFVR